MENKKKSASSIPADYVSLVQLKERWLQEKQREEEEEEEREKRLQEKERQQREKEEEGRRREDKRGQKKNGDEASPEIQSTSRRSLRRKGRKMYVEVHPKPQDKEALAVAVVEVKRTDESQEKGKKKRNKAKSRLKNKMIGGATAQPIPENVVEAGARKVVPEKKDGVQAVEKQPSEFPLAGRKFLGEKPPVYRVVEIKEKLEHLSVNGNGKLPSEIPVTSRKILGESAPVFQEVERLSVNGSVYAREYATFGAYGQFQARKRRDCSVMWVKKGEASSDGNVAMSVRR